MALDPLTLDPKPLALNLSAADVEKYAPIPVCACVCVCVCVCVNVCVYLCMRLYQCACVCICLCVYCRAHKHACVHVLAQRFFTAAKPHHGQEKDTRTPSRSRKRHTAHPGHSDGNRCIARTKRTHSSKETTSSKRTHSNSVPSLPGRRVTCECIHAHR